MKLLIYNNTNRFSTVLNAILEEAKDAFDKIYVVFSKNYAAEKEYGNYGGKVAFVTPKKSQCLKAVFCTAMDLMGRDTCKDFALAKKKNQLCVAFLKRYMYGLYTANLLYAASKDTLKEEALAAVFSTWYEANAVAAAKAAKKYPHLFAASYAHSYEVDFRKNPYTVIGRDRYKEKYLDEVYFISQKVMEEYVALNGDVLNHPEKCQAVHFGSTKKQEGLSPKSEDGIFRILTCSGVSPVKRLDVLAEALALYQGKQKIEWTVLGDGPDMEKVKEIAKKADAQKVSIRFQGSVSNEDVHRYYAENPVDLFINVSSSEGLPVSIMEAMSYGVPTLATDVGGNHEIVTLETGYPIGAEISAEGLCRDITAITGNIEECAKKREAAFAMWENNYRIDKNVAIVIERLKHKHGTVAGKK